MVSIIILSYNTEKLLQTCLASIYSKLKAFDFETIVLDNASDDNSVGMVKREFEKVRVIRSKENLGFAKGVNYAATFAKGSYLLFLNSDAKLHDDSLQTMVQFLEEHPKAAAIGGKLLNSDNSTSKSYGKFYTLREVFLMLFGSAKKKDTESNHVKKVEWVSGGCMLMRKDIFDELSGFDEHFFMYIEDMELCYRLKKKGYEVYFDPRVVVSHMGQGSSNRGFAIIHIYKGLLYFYKKHMPMWQYHIVRMMLIGKGSLAMTFGRLTHNAYLANTYRKALQYSL